MPENDVGDTLARSAGVVLPPESGSGSGGDPSPEDFAKILEFGDDRIERKPSDYYAFRMIVSSDGLDSFHTKPDPKTSLPNYVEDLKRGQSLLGSHQTTTYSTGTSFDGELVEADPIRREYEAAFFRRYAERPEAATSQWAIGKFAIPRHMTVNGQNTDDLIRGIQLGAIRRSSISFTVGQYRCGLDGNDMIAGFFGPEGTGDCRHMPGITYGDDVAWAVMVDNDLHETSLVFKNSSPSAMFLRKAEEMASRGMLTERDIVRLEERTMSRLPRHTPAYWNGQTIQVSTTGTVVDGQARIDAQKETAMAEADERHPGHFHVGLNVDAEDIKGGHGSDYPDDQPPGDEVDDPEAAAEMLAPGILDQLKEEGEEGAEAPPEEETPADKLAALGKKRDPAVVTPEVSATDQEVDAIAEQIIENEDSAVAEAEAEPAEAETAEAEAEPAEAEAETAEAEAEDERHPGHYHDADTKGGHFTKKPKPFEKKENKEPIDVYHPRPPRPEEDRMTQARAAAREVLGRMAAYETRDTEIAEVIGEPVTVEAVRRLQRDAKLGNDLFNAEVDKAVKARIAVDGESFNAEKWRSLLASSRDIELVQQEIDTLSKRRTDTFLPGRQVRPGPLPEKKAPTAARSEPPGSNIIESMNQTKR